MNQEFKKVLQTKYPHIFDKNEKFIISECEMIYRIDVSCCSIKVIDGLDIFTNLQTLVCDNNQLTSLDVQGLVKLKTLRCYNNQLTSLDVQGLANLQTLDCDKSIQLDVGFVFNTSNYCAFLSHKMTLDAGASREQRKNL